MKNRITTSKIGVLMSEGENRNLLSSLIAEKHQVNLLETAPDTKSDDDLFIVDYQYFSKFFENFKKFRMSNDLSQGKVILLQSRNSTEISVEIQDTCDDIIQIPIQKSLFINKIDNFLELKKIAEKNLILTSKLESQVNELEQTKKNLIKAKMEAEKANQAKSSFLSNMSHEIRTPLGAIIGFNEILKKDDISYQDRYEYHNIMSSNAHQLMQIVNDILDLSKIESGQLTIEKYKFSLPIFLKDFIASLRHKAVEKNLELKYSLPSFIPNFLISDPTRLRQILTNIVGNALKFTSKGSVDIQLEFKKNSLKIYVKDTGPGITEKQVNKLFQPFQQADSSTTRNFGGTGLGLILSRNLCQAMGGDLVLEESAVGKGSTFAIEVGAKIPDKAKWFRPSFKKFSSVNNNSNKKEIDENLKDLNVLLVEDSKDNQLLFEIFLKSVNANFTIANNGSLGVKEALKGEFDVVLMDIQMPVMDGYEAIKKLKSHGYSTPVIALTANALNVEREKSLSLGFNDYLTKPIKKETLINTIIKHGRNHSLRI